MHNAGFDLAVADRHFGLLPKRFDDTLLMAFLDAPDAPALGLKDLAADRLGVSADEEARLHQWINDNLPKAPGLKPAERMVEVPGAVVADYAIGDVVRTRALYDLLRPRINAAGMDGAYRRELDLVPVLIDMTRRGVAIDRDRLARDVAAWGVQLEQLEQSIRTRLGAERGLNLNSGQQLANALEKAAAVDPSAWIPTATGGRSTKVDNLRLIVKDAELLDLLDLRASLGSYISTYGRAWLKMSAADGRLHVDWNATRRPDRKGGAGARTGRITAKPNLQNIPNPVAGLPNLRNYLTPGAGRCFLDRDYSQQEYRVAAHYTTAVGGALSEQYQRDPGLDVHEVARFEIERTLGIHIERDQAKTLNLAILYGMGINSLASGLRVSVDQARRFRDVHARAFPDLADLSRRMSQAAQCGRPLRTWGGRVYYPETNYEYRFLNTLIQGGAADMTKAAMIRAHQAGLEMVLTSHDQLTIVSDVGDAGLNMDLLRAAMEGVEFYVPLQTDASWSQHGWGSLEPWPPAVR